MAAASSAYRNLGDLNSSMYGGSGFTTFSGHTTRSTGRSMEHVASTCRSKTSGLSSGLARCAVRRRLARRRPRAYERRCPVVRRRHATNTSTMAAHADRAPRTIDRGGECHSADDGEGDEQQRTERAHHRSDRRSDLAHGKRGERHAAERPAPSHELGGERESADRRFGALPFAGTAAAAQA